MSEHNHTTESEPRSDERAGDGPSPRGPGQFDMASCCGTMVGDGEKGCPCSAVMKRHRLAFFTVLSIVFLAFLVSQVGGILGIIAFTRTF